MYQIGYCEAISKKEATTLAKNYLTEKGIEKNCILFFSSVEDSVFYDNAWAVTFPPSPKIMFRIPFSFSVHIDKETGDILLGGWNK